MTLPDHDYLVCSRVSGDEPVHASVGIGCADCMFPIWVAPSGQKLLAKGHVAICVECGIKRMQADPKPEIVPLSEEQIAELRAEWRRR